MSIKILGPTLFLSVCLLVFNQNIYSQQKVIRGIVTGPNGMPLQGATVSIIGSNTISLTDKDGNFTITAKVGDILEISFVGYKSQQIKVESQTDLKISLSETAINLDEILLTGYSTQKVKEITGSVGVVRAKELTSIPSGQVEQLLQGRIAGLTVITSGEPGTASNIRLHGIGNFGDVTPLYIIDGVEGNINGINPYDIQSIQVLKDAGAYSIYGVRGANGVLVITTKKGRPGKTKINYDFYIGTTRPLKKGLDLLNPQENADLLWLALRNTGLVGSNGNPSHMFYGNGPTPVLPDYLFAGNNVRLFEGDPLADPDKYNIDPSVGEIYQIVRFNKQGTDWFHEGFKPALSQNHTVTVSGGSENNQFLFSLGYLDQNGTLLNSFLRRFTTRVNSEFNVLNRIRIGENLQLSYTENPKTNFNYGPVVGQILRTDPFLPLHDIKGNASGYGAAGIGIPVLPNPVSNIVALREKSKEDKYHGWQIFGNAYAEIDLYKSLTLRSSFGGFLNHNYSYFYFYGSYEPPPSGYASNFYEQSGYARSWTWTNTLSYSGTFGKDHSVKALVGIEEKSNYDRKLGGSRIGYFTDDLNYRFLSNGSPDNQNNFSVAGISWLSSFMSQVNYNYQQKYFLSGTVRRDGSSIFGPKNRFGWFPAVAAAWRVTEENFMENLDWLTDLKLRASWGKTGYYGNTDPFNQYTLYGASPGGSYYDIGGTGIGSQQGFRTVRIGNPETGWQEDIVTNVGFESTLWNGKLSVTADWYNKSSTGLLFQVSLPALLGDAISPNVNVGNVRNTGIDVSINSKGKFSRDWRWDVMATISTYHSKIVKLNNLPSFDDAPNGIGFLVRNEVGYPISSFFGYKVIGFFQDSADVARSPVQEAASPGRFKYADVNGRDSMGKLTGKPDGLIDPDDRVHFGNPNPRFTLGVNIGVTYKNFDFTTFFYGSFGNDVLNEVGRTVDIFSASAIGPRSKTALYDAWSPQNPNAHVPIPEFEQNFSTAGVVNSYSLEKGTYFRNKSMMLGYTFPTDRLKKINIERFRIYIQAVNLFTITNYSGLDPELSGVHSGMARTSSFGIDMFGNYPNNQKQWFIGLNLSF